MAGEVVLVTGGAGFIGSHVVDELIARGFDVRVFDNLDPQVHGDDAKPPAYLNPRCEFVQGDIRDRKALSDAMRGVRRVVHLAASVSSAQSMYQAEKYCDVNVRGTGALIDAMANISPRPVSLVLASSCTVYGEGSYECTTHGVFAGGFRDPQRIAERKWEIVCPSCGRECKPVATPEDRPLTPATVYAITKRTLEDLALVFGRIFGVRTLSLRYFGVYGPRQSLSNPYTGAVVNFLTRIANQRAPLVFEDGHQSRDFVFVKDVARATALAVTSDTAASGAYNVCTGNSVTVLQVIDALYEAFGTPPSERKSEILYQWRAGDIRHCFADTSKLRREVGFEPGTSFVQGIREVVEWARQQKVFVDRTDAALHDLTSRGLSR